MRPRDEKKRAAILATAARLFAREPFHKVRLDDVAAAAQVGKGTLYIYFKSKEDLFFGILYTGFSELLERLKQQLENEPGPAAARLEIIVRNLVDYAFQQPQFWELMRNAVDMGPLATSDWQAKRQELLALIRGTLDAAIASGEFRDPHPELTAAYIPSFIRAAMLYGPRDLAPSALVDHIMQLLKQGLAGHAPADAPP